LSTVHTLGMVGLVLGSSAQLTFHAIVTGVLLWRALKNESRVQSPKSKVQAEGETTQSERSDAGLRTQDFLKVGGAAALMALVSYGTWLALGNFVQPSSLPGELVLLGVPALLGGSLYASMVW